MYLTTLDRDFDRIVRRTFGGSPFNAAFTSGGPALPMDIVQRHGEVVLRFDIPGIDPEKIDLTVDKGVLSVTAAREEAAESEDDQHVVRERYHGSATRSVRLSDSLDTDKIEASNANGVLEIRIPVREESKARKIMIGAKKELAG
jgi:HSP20 family protein